MVSFGLLMSAYAIASGKVGSKKHACRLLFCTESASILGKATGSCIETRKDMGQFGRGDQDPSFKERNSFAWT